MKTTSKHELTRNTAHGLDAMSVGQSVIVTERGVPRLRIDTMERSGNPLARLRAGGRITRAIRPALASLALLVGAETASAQGVDHSRMDHDTHMATMASGQRQADVAQRGEEVMPFSLAATTHIFTKTAQGGIQQVVARQSDDVAQVSLIRQHLREIREQFLKGDYSGPTRIHGHEMPGLAELKTAAPGQVAIVYADITDGAELSYTTANAALVSALHRWFEAQLSDHGEHATTGHAGHGEMKKP